MKSFFKNMGLVGAGLLGGVLLTVGLTALAFKGESGFPVSDLRAFTEVFGAVKRYYVEPVENNKLLSSAVAGMLSDLDPHSAYLDKEAFKQMQESTSGEFGGVGMEIGNEDGYIKVQTPIEGGPSERAGIKTGDLITKIEDKSTKGMSSLDAVKLLRGVPGTKVNFTVLHKGDPLPQVVVITREIIKIQSVRSKNLPDGVAYVRITQFQERTTQDLVKHLNRLAENGVPKALVLDLRNNPGGLLYSSVGVSAVFLPKNQTIVSVRGRQESTVYKTVPKDYRGETEDPLKGAPAWAQTVPLTVLMNQGSASASEIVGGALRDYNRGKILGTRSFGKGSVQNILPLPNEGAIKLTIARYYTPKDISIQAKGIEPDFNVEETADGNPFAEFMQRESDNDRALDNGGKPASAKTPEERNKESEDRLKRLEKLRAEGRKPPEYGDVEKDYQLQQAMNLIQGKPVATVKAEAKKEDVKKDEAKK